VFTRRQAAFILTCQRLLEQNERLYFWTFTFTEAQNDYVAMSAWSLLWRKIARHFCGEVQGVRVTELHKTHGIHHHAIINRRLSVGELRRFSKRYGFGRVQVERATESDFHYLAKYLTKDAEPLQRGMRRWRCLNLRGVTNASLECVSIGARACRGVDRVHWNRVTWSAYEKEIERRGGDYPNVQAYCIGGRGRGHGGGKRTSAIVHS